MYGMNGCNKRSACSSTVSKRVRAKFFLARRFFRSDVSFGQFDIPIAEVVPEEVIQSLHRFMKLITFQSLAHVASGLIQTREDPAIV